MSEGPVAVIGVPLYNGGAFFERAIGSLLSQTERRLALVLVDDGSSDGTGEAAERAAARDPRVVYVRNERRLGLVGNWRRCYEEAMTRFPQADYFAWGSDHDVWEPRWLEEMIAALEAHPDCVLAYPYSVRVGPDGEHLTHHRRYSSAHMRDPLDRLKHTFAAMAAGNKIYGLFRTDAIRRAGVFRDVLLPDRLLLAEASIEGGFVEVPEILWLRRQLGQATIARQRVTLFSEPPSYINLPWWLQHIGVFTHAYLIRGGGRSRREGAYWSAQYARTVLMFQYRRTRRRRRLPFALQRKHLRKWVHRHFIAPAAEIVASTLEAMRFPLRRPARPEADPAPLTVAPPPTPSEDVAYSRAPTVVEAQLTELTTELGTVKKTLMAGMNRVAQIEESIADSRRAIVRQEGARVKVEDPRFTELVRPVVESERTMLSVPRLYTLYNAVSNSARPGVAMAEVGTFRGGTAYFLASAAAERLGEEVPLFVFDTFEGHPEHKITSEIEPEQYVGNFSETTFEDVREYLSGFEKVQVIAGEATASLRELPDQQFALVHLDVDLYLPTLECLRYFVERLVPGGAIVVDDFGAPSCPGIIQAVDEFLAEHAEFACWPMLTEQAVLVRK
ncbi:glycosyltransferase [Solirubrobacter soli]|uniref:glycosyltransferase n=1 Tax=Solirubrobacter soli TaxID=363832 RepID=UPI0004130C48|nr:glycosyltransferase [Solirubrobacter soli]